MSPLIAAGAFFIIWWLCLLMSLPFGLRTQDEEGEVVPGTPGSAPAKPRFLLVFVMATVLAVFFFSILYFGIESGWITTDTFNFLH